MKGFKRAIAIMLTMVMLLGSVPTNIADGLFWVKASATGEPEETVPALMLDNGVTVEEETLFSFTPEEDGIYEFYTVSDPPIDPKGYLLDENRQQLAENDDGGDEINFKLRYTMTAGVTYYVRASAYDNLYPYVLYTQKASATDEPEATVPGATTGSGVTVPDATTAPGVTVPDATSAPEGVMPEEVGAALVLDNGVTVETETLFSFTPEYDGTYEFYSASDGSSDPRAYLLDENRQQLSEDDDNGGNFNFYIRYTMTAGVTYYVWASAYCGNFPYVIYVQQAIETDEPDATVPEETTPAPTEPTPSETTPVPEATEPEATVSALVLGNGVTVEEETLFSFTPEEDGIYNFYSVSVSPADPKVYLLDENRQQLAVDDDSGYDLNFNLYYTLTAGVTYYVWASAFNGQYPYVFYVGSGLEPDATEPSETTPAPTETTPGETVPAPTEPTPGETTPVPEVTEPEATEPKASVDFALFLNTTSNNNKTTVTLHEGEVLYFVNLISPAHHNGNDLRCLGVGDETNWNLELDYTGEVPVMTLKGLDINSGFVGIEFGSFTAPISSDLVIVIEEDSLITSAETTGNNYYSNPALMLGTTGTVTIQSKNNAKLTLQADNNYATNGNKATLYAGGNLVLDGANVVVEGCAAWGDCDYGIYAVGNVTVSGGELVVRENNRQTQAINCAAFEAKNNANVKIWMPNSDSASSNKTCIEAGSIKFNAANVSIGAYARAFSVDPVVTNVSFYKGSTQNPRWSGAPGELTFREDMGNTGDYTTWKLVKIVAGEEEPAPSVPTPTTPSATTPAGAMPEEIGPALTLSNGVTVETETLFSFTPEEDGIYNFYSVSVSPADPKVYLLDENRQQLAVDDDSGYDLNFNLYYTLTAGVTYYVWASAFCGQFPYVFYVESEPKPDATEPEATVSALVLGNGVTVEEETLFSFTPEEDGIYNFYSVSVSPADPKVYLLDENRQQLAVDDDSGYDLNFNLYYTLTAGVTYYVWASAFNGQYPYVIYVQQAIETGEPDATVPEETTPAPTEPTPSETTPVPEATEPEATVSALVLGNGVTVEEETLFSFTPEEDGTYRFYSVSEGSADPRMYLLDENRQQLVEDDDSGDGYNFELHYILTAGVTYYVWASAYNDQYPYVMYVEPSAVESFFVEDMVVAEGTNGYLQYVELSSGATDYWYYYNAEAAQITVNLTNGEVVTGTAWELKEQGYRVNITSEDYQSYDHQWGVGTYQFTASFMGLEVKFNYTLEESDLVGIDVPDLTYMEGTGGWWQEYYDEDGNLRYYYQYNWMPEEITVEFSNGTFVTGTEDENYEQLGYDIRLLQDQGAESPWGVGTHRVILYIGGLRQNFNVTITPTNIKSLSAEPVTLTEHIDGWWNYYWDEIAEQKYFWYNVVNNVGDITVTYTDNTTFTGTREEIYEHTGFEVAVLTDQSSYNQWGVGTHAATIAFSGATVDVPVTIEKFPVASIEVPNLTLMEGTSDCWCSYPDENGELRYYYCYNVEPEEFTVHFADGTSITGTPEEIAEQTGLVYWMSCDQNWDNQWGVGTHTATLHFAGLSYTYTVTITPANVKSISAEPLTFTEHTHGGWNTYWDENGEQEYYCYSVINYLGKITITYEDDTTFTGYRWQIEDQLGFDVGVWTNQEWDNQWGVGTHTATIGIAGKTAEIPVTITGSPFASIEVPNLTLVEGTGGYRDSYYDEDGNLRHYYHYNVVPEEFTIHFTDGTSITGTGDEIIEQTGYEFGVSHDQSGENPWGVGTHTATLRFAGLSQTYNVIIEDSNVASITVPNRTYTEGTGGWWKRYYSDEAGNERYYYYYNAEPEEFTIHFTDGTSITGYGREIYEQTGLNVEVLTNQSGDNPWDVGTHTATIYIGGESQTFNVTITPTRIQSITVEPVIAVAGRDGWTNSEYYDPESGCYFPGVWYEYGYSPEIMTVTFTDGTKAIWSHETLRAEGYDVQYLHDQSYHNQWETGSHTVTMVGVGFEASYTVEVIEPVEGEAFSYGVLPDGTAVLLGYNGSATELVIPETIDGHTVRVLGKEMLKNSNVEILTIPASVEIIEREAFAHSYYLRTLELQATELKISTEAFYYCYSLEKVIFSGTAQERKNLSDNILWGNDHLLNTQWVYDVECTEHAYEWIIDDPGDCVNDGYKHEYCILCGVTRNEYTVIPAKGEHTNTELRNASPATCDKWGFTGDLYCLDCDCYVEYGELIEPTDDHKNTVIRDRREATCSQPGCAGNLYCKDCETILEYGEVFEPTGNHVYDHDYDPNCNECGAVREVAKDVGKLSMNSITAYQGETIRVNISIAENAGFAALQFGVLFDNTYLTLKDVETQMDGFHVTVGNSIVLDAIKNYTADGVIVTLVFEVAENAPVGEYDVQLRFMSGSNDAFEEVLMTNCETTITVENIVAGDANGDGVVTTVDLVMLRAYLASVDPITGVSEITVKKGADYNDDGVVNAIDLAYVRQYLASMPA